MKKRKNKVVEAVIDLSDLCTCDVEHDLWLHIVTPSQSRVAGQRSPVGKREKIRYENSVLKYHIWKFAARLCEEKYSVCIK
jgi:hypothetical protein